jgi:hypothetical protein
MLADYLQAAIPTPTILLGQRLRPFCLGLNFILLRHNSGFLAEDGQASFGDLIFGVFICCHSYEEALEAIERPDLGKTLEKWAKRLGAFDVAAKAEEFRNYLRAGYAFPDVLPGDGEGVRTPGAPFLQLVKVTAMGDLHYGRSEALNAPLGEVLHDYFAFWERKGAAKIMGPDEKAHLDAAEEIKKLIDAEGGWHAL